MNMGHNAIYAFQSLQKPCCEDSGLSAIFIALSPVPRARWGPQCPFMGWMNLHFIFKVPDQKG